MQMKRNTGLIRIVKIYYNGAIIGINIGIIIGMFGQKNMLLVETEDIDSFCTRFGRDIIIILSGILSRRHIKCVS